LEASRAGQAETPNTKIQASEKHQTPNPKKARASVGLRQACANKLSTMLPAAFLDLGFWIFSGAWIFVFGAFFLDPDYKPTPLLQLSPASPRYSFVRE
jgi:hypothetical protein